MISDPRPPSAPGPLAGALRPVLRSVVVMPRVAAAVPRRSGPESLDGTLEVDENGIDWANMSVHYDFFFIFLACLAGLFTRHLCLIFFYYYSLPAPIGLSIAPVLYLGFR